MSMNVHFIKELRHKTGSGMMDCKKALIENNSNIEEAVAWLRKKGLASANKKAGRDTSEGVVAIMVSRDCATIIELNAETDFVARNEKFINLADKIVRKAHEFQGGDVEKFLESNEHGASPIQNIIAENISIIGENIILKKIDKLNINKGKIVPYLHNKLADNIGKIGVLIALEGEINNAIEEFGKQLGMHIAASNPLSLSIKSLDQAIIDKERKILRDQALESGKPVNVLTQMIEGRIRKFLETIVLFEQPFVIDGKTKVKKVIEDLKLKHNCNFNISGYLRYEIGE